MSFYQRLVRDVLYPLDRWRTGDYGEMHHLREFERTQFLPEEEIRALQLARLCKLLEHAYRQCPFYRERFQQAGLLPSDIRTLDDLAALPALEKRDIQENRDRLVARNWPTHDLLPNQTGGSTGSPLSFFMSRDRLHSRAAATWRHNRWAGWDLGDKVALLWGAPRDRPANHWRSRLRNLLLDRRLFLDTGHLTEARLADFHEALKRFRPKVLLAYAGSMVLFARYLQGRRQTPYQPQAIVTSAEVLEPADRALVEAMFGCPVFNRYGCREVSVIASECEEHAGLHTMAEGLFVEVTPSPPAPLPQAPSFPAPLPQGERGVGEVGPILVTDLINFAMPLIRYRIGDLGSWEAGPCKCGRGLPRLKAIAGRVTDFLVGGDGRLVSGVFLATYLVAQRPSLGQVQIHQEKAGQLLYRIKPGHAFRERADLDYLQETSRHYLGEETVIDWEFVAELGPEPSGKFLFSRSNVVPEYLSAECGVKPGGL
jgi:phenylacetate-CoA ligase